MSIGKIVSRMCHYDARRIRIHLPSFTYNPEKGWSIWPIDKILSVLSFFIYGLGFTEGIISDIRVAGYNQSGLAYHTFVWIYALTYWLAASIFGSILL